MKTLHNTFWTDWCWQLSLSLLAFYFSKSDEKIMRWNKNPQAFIGHNKRFIERVQESRTTKIRFRKYNKKDLTVSPFLTATSFCPFPRIVAHDLTKSTISKIRTKTNLITHISESDSTFGADRLLLMDFLTLPDRLNKTS